MGTSNSTKRRHDSIAWIIAFSTIAIFSAIFINSINGHDGVSIGQAINDTETPTPDIATATITPTLDPMEVYNPIFTETDAISRTMREISITHYFTPTQTIARLMRHDDFRIWSDQSGGSGSSAYSSFFIEIPPEDPIWLVGIAGDSLVASDVMVFVDDVYGDDMVSGVYYAWDARSGFQLESAPLWNSSTAAKKSLAMIVSIPNSSIPIATLAFVPTPRPSPDPDTAP
jgi:hypothetical protein